MAFPSGRHDAYSPLAGEGQQLYASPSPMQSQWNPNLNHGDLGSPEIELQQGFQPQHRPSYPPHRESGTSFASMNSQSTLFPSNTMTPQPFETQSFLHDPSNKIDTTFATPEYQPFKDNTARQLRHLLIKSSSRFLITAALCAGYILATKVWINKDAVDEKHKKIYNTITTGLSLALGLNIASAFKDMALNMRWPILAARKRNLRELDLFLRADSLTELFKLVFVTRRFWVITACLAWLFINLVAQVGIALLSLTYSFDVNYDAVLSTHGTFKAANMTHFFPRPDDVEDQPTLPDEQYTANAYGGLAYNLYGWAPKEQAPKTGDIFKQTNPMLWWDEPNRSLEYIFSNEENTVNPQGKFAAYSTRIVNATYNCNSHKVLKNGTGQYNNLEVEGRGDEFVSSVVPEMTTYYTQYTEDNDPWYFCNNEYMDRCATIKVFEASKLEQPWWYVCNITIGHTQNDPYNISFIDDLRAGWAAASIAQIGYTNEGMQQVQIYPGQSSWGVNLQGDADKMGQRIATFALGSIAGAAMFGPKIIVEGDHAPHQAFKLNLNHDFFFYLIMGLIMGCHLLFVVVVGVLANRVKVGPEGHLSMSLLLRPIADALEGVSGGRENKAFQKAKKAYSVRYEKSRNGRWVLAMS